MCLLWIRCSNLSFFPVPTYLVKMRSYTDRTLAFNHYILQVYVYVPTGQAMIPIQVSDNHVHIIELFSVVCREHAPCICTCPKAWQAPKKHIYMQLVEICDSFASNSIHYNMYWSTYFPFTLRGYTYYLPAMFWSLSISSLFYSPHTSKWELDHHCFGEMFKIPWKSHHLANICQWYSMPHLAWHIWYLHQK